jgi:hypothetical protein
MPHRMSRLICPMPDEALERVGETPIYQLDPVVRRSPRFRHARRRCAGSLDRQ